MNARLGGLGVASAGWAPLSLEQATMMQPDDPKTKGGMFGLDVPDIVRFVYSGFLAVGLLQLTPIQADLNARLNSLGDVVSVLLILSLGIVIWTLYHQVIGEILWFQVVHLIHKKIPWVRNTSDMLLLEDCGVPFGKRRMAYQMFRSSYLSPADRQWVELSHAYNQLLGITWVEIAFVLAYWRSGVEDWLLLSTIGILCVLADIFVDIRQHAIERNLMTKEGVGQFKNWLAQAGVLNSESVTGQSQHERA